MLTFNAISGKVFDLLLSPLVPLGAWVAFIFISVVTAILLVLTFKVASDQSLITRRKNRTVARLLEFRLFRDDPIVSLGALKRVLSANVSYILSLARPIAVGLLPMAVILVQTGEWFHARPLRPGESGLLKLRLLPDRPVMESAISLDVPEALIIEVGPVIDTERNEALWRLRARNTQSAWVDLTVDGKRLRKNVSIGKPPARISHRRVRACFWQQFTNPSEPPLPEECPVDLIEITYPPSVLSIRGKRVNWAAAFAVLTILAAWILRKPLHVEI